MKSTVFVWPLLSARCFDNKRLLVLSTVWEAEGGNEDGGWRKEGQVRFDLALGSTWLSTAGREEW